jgi:hypothetical protein
LVGSTEISMRSGDLALGTYAPSPDTVRFGNVFSLRFFAVNDPLPAVCGAKPTFAVQFLSSAIARQRADSSAAWSQHTTYSDSLVPLDSIGSGTQANPPVRAPGFNLVAAGQNNNCSGSEFVLAPRWNRLVFLHRPTAGVGDYYAKVAITAYRDTSFGMLPYYHVLRSFTLTYVLNNQRLGTQPVDLSGGTVAIRPARPARGSARFGAGVEYELYNPLGIRLRHGAGKYEPALPASRNSQNRQ